MNAPKTSLPYEVCRVSLYPTDVPLEQRQIQERRTMDRFISVTRDYGPGSVSGWGSDEIFFRLKHNPSAFNGLWDLMHKLDGTKPLNKIQTTLLLSAFPNSAKKRLLEFKTPAEFIAWVSTKPTEVIEAMEVTGFTTMSRDTKLYRASALGFSGPESAAFIDTGAIPARFLSKPEPKVLSATPPSADFSTPPVATTVTSAVFSTAIT